MTVPETLPAFDALTVDDLGYLWVTRPQGDANEPVQWDVFDPTGALLGTINGPPGMATHLAPQVGEDFLMVLEIGAYGVEMVRIYGLDRRN